jgi:hypothetical protein
MKKRQNIAIVSPGSIGTILEEAEAGDQYARVAEARLRVGKVRLDRLIFAGTERTLLHAGDFS